MLLLLLFILFVILIIFLVIIMTITFHTSLWLLYVYDVHLDLVEAQLLNLTSFQQMSFEDTLRIVGEKASK